MTLLSRLRSKVSHNHPEVLNSITTQSRPDSRGFDQVMLTAPGRRQITAVSSVANAPLIDDAQVNAWNAEMSTTDRMMLTFVADATDPAVAPVLGATFRAAGKAERKDVTELATWMTIHAPALYDTADLVGLDATPMSETQLASRCGSILTAGEDAGFTRINDLTELDWDEADDHVSIDAVSFSVFTIATSVPGVSEDLDDLLSTWDLPAQVTRTRWMRPYAHPELLKDLDLHTPGRTWSTVTVTGGAGSDMAFIKALHPATRLHTRRAYCRQSLLLASSLCLGPAGFQNLTVDKDLLQ